MDRSEALRILSVRCETEALSATASVTSVGLIQMNSLASCHRDSAGKDKVMEAWKKVLTANHPDQGGSDYIAAKVNEAKDILVGKGGKQQF